MCAEGWNVTEQFPLFKKKNQTFKGKETTIEDDESRL